MVQQPVEQVKDVNFNLDPNSDMEEIPYQSIEIKLITDTLTDIADLLKMYENVDQRLLHNQRINYWKTTIKDKNLKRRFVQGEQESARKKMIHF